MLKAVDELVTLGLSEIARTSDGPSSVSLLRLCKSTASAATIYRPVRGLDAQHSPSTSKRERQGHKCWDCRVSSWPKLRGLFNALCNVCVLLSCEFRTWSPTIVSYSASKRWGLPSVERKGFSNLKHYLQSFGELWQLLATHSRDGRISRDFDRQEVPVRGMRNNCSSTSRILDEDRVMSR